jgi:hypothetical protein
MRIHDQSRQYRRCALSLCALLVGCGIGDGQEASDHAPESTASANEAFSTFSQSSYQAGPGGRYDLKQSVKGTTCFLEKVEGNLGGNLTGAALTPSATTSNTNGYTNYDGSPYTTPAWSYDPGWVLDMSAQISVQVMCIRGTALWPSVTLWGASSHELADLTQDPNVRCGLIGVGGYYDNFENSEDGVSVTIQNKKWVFNATGLGSGTALCVDTTPNTDLSEWTWRPGPSNPTSITLLDAPASGSSPLGTQCFLTGVGGAFTNESSTVSVDYTTLALPLMFGGTVLDSWSLHADRGLTASATCVH